MTNDTICILKDLKTITIVYKLSVTNLEFTLGLIESKDQQQKDLSLPMSLRVEDSSIERSNGGDIVDFIFAKEACIDKYNKILVSDKNKTIPDCVKHLINSELYNLR